MSQLALYLLGPPRIELYDKPVQISRRKVVALLAYLAVTSTPHSRDALATLLWPERSQSRARAYLRRALSELSRAIGEGFLTIDRESAGIDPAAAVWLDVDAFRGQLAACDANAHGHPAAEVCADCLAPLEEAVALYHDDFLAGFTLRDSPAFDEWQFFQSEDLRDALAGALQRLARWHSGQGEYERAIGYARRWVALDPLHEPAQRLLIQLYAQSGQRAAARRQYQECVRILKEELGASPSAETQALYERIIVGEPEIITPPVRTVRGYELRERIGSGGFGEVYRAYQPSVARDVAVKVILPRYADHPEFVRRFETEAQLVARLEHPHIVPLYDYWRDSEGAYLVMRWLRGGNLHQALQRGPWSPEAAMQLLDQIADALAVAHRQGVVHRDIKPENILLDQEGNAYLSDFGIAKDLAHAAAVTDPDAVPGSLWYISPEQAKSEPVTPQSDIYSLGIVMYQVLTGEHPFSGLTPPDQLIKRLTEPLPPLRVHRTDLPAALELVIQRATASDLAERYPDAPAFGREFRKALSGMEVVVPAPSPARIHNLPAQATPFIGREAELAEIGKLLSDPNCRLLTLVGPGGSGKTRLALEAAAARLDANRHEHGAFFVSLAPLESVDAIVPTVADALGFRFYGAVGGTPGTPQEQLLSYLRQKNLLLIMDNYEHLLEGVGLVSEIIKTAPEVKILATSRARLNVGGEHRFHVGGMAYPREGIAGAPPVLRHAQDAVQYSAVKLFLQGAHRAQPGFELTDANVSDVVDLCRLLEGMPLAIRLAAAWVEMLTPAEIASQMRGSLDLLETERQDVPERQRSMRAAFDHSWKLLSDRQREVLAGLSVFRGGFIQEDAQAVTGALLRDLRALVDRSLLQREIDASAAPGTRGRYQMHELLRQYAIEKLNVNPSAAQEVHDRHCATYTAALQRWDAGLMSARELETRKEMELEIENAREAWEWAVAHQQVERLNQALDGLCRFLWWHSRFEEGEAVCRVASEKLTAFTTRDATRLQVRILAWQALLCQSEDTTEAHQLLERSWALLKHPELQNLDTRREQALLHSHSGLLLSGTNPQQSRASLRQSLGLFRSLNDQWCTASTSRFLGELAVILGTYDEAERWYQQSLDIQQVLRHPGELGFSLAGLGMVALVQGRFEESVRLLQQAVQKLAETAHRINLAMGLVDLGMGLVFVGENDQACLRLKESLAIWDDLGRRVDGRLALFGLIIAELSRGGYKDAHALGQELLGLTEETGGRTIVDDARAHWVLGMLALAEEAYAEAQEQLGASLAAYRKFGLPNELVMVLADAAVAACGLGQPEMARQYLHEALQTTIDAQIVLSLLHILPIAGLFFASVGEPEQAAEVYALASRYPYVANSRWFEDVVGKHIAAAVADLPPDVVEAAKERGRGLDLWANAEELLEELKNPKYDD